MQHPPVSPGGRILKIRNENAGRLRVVEKGQRYGIIKEGINMERQTQNADAFFPSMVLSFCRTYITNLHMIVMMNGCAYMHCLASTVVLRTTHLPSKNATFCLYQ